MDHDRIFVVGIGGSTRQGSSTEVVVRSVLDSLEKAGAETRLYAGEELILPMYQQTPSCAALDYFEELSGDESPYLDRKAVGCVATAYGWQAAVNTLTTLRQIVHALRGWPTPYGIAINAAGGIVNEDGTYRDERQQLGIDVMVQQILDFSRAMRALTPAH